MNWLNRIFHRRSLYNDLSEEMRQHLEEKTAQLQREGLSRNEAEQAARRSFGNPTLLEQRSREVWQWPRLENLLRDLSFSARLLRKSPGFTLVAVLTLTLGIGANTAIFSLLNGLLLRPLDIPQADRLVVLKLRGGEIGSFCAPLVRALEPRHEVFQNVFGFSTSRFQVREPDGIKLVLGSFVTGQYFGALRTPAQLGRTLLLTDDSKDYHSAAFPAVISDAFWTTHFHRDRGIVGQTLVVSGVPFTVVGVMPKGFYGFDVTARPQLWIPLSTEPRVDAPFNMLDDGYRMWWLNAGARLQPETSRAQADAWLNSVTPAILRQVIPDPHWQMFGHVRRENIGLSADPGSAGFSDLRAQYRRPLLLIFAFCAALLLVACINLASLLLARAALRQREIATRLAIGATRRRIIQQLLIDSMLLALLGTVAGLCIAPLASRALVSMLTRGGDYLYLDASIDWRVGLFVAVIAIAATILVGLAPALEATTGDLTQHIKDGSHSIHAAHRRLLPKFLLAIEVALAMVLVSGAGLLSASLFRLYHSGFGFDPHNLLIADADTGKQPLEGEPLLSAYRELRVRIAALPEVKSVAYTDITPVSGNSWMSSMHAPGGSDRDVWGNTVSPGYFATLHIPLLAGRDFNTQDSSAKETRILINQSAARMFFPSGNAVGKGLRNSGDVPKPETYRVIGIVGGTKYASLRDPAPPMIYRPIQFNPDFKKPEYSLLVRYTGSAKPIAPAVRQLFAQLIPGAPPPSFITLERQIDERIAGDRVMALLSIFFALSALLVTAIGLYGVLAYSTARRTSEIGIRMALGAGRAQVVALVFRENLWTAIAGCAAGLATAVLASRALASFLYGTSPRDPWILSVSLAVLCLVAAIASLIPAIRAASVDPMQALRSE